MKLTRSLWILILFNALYILIFSAYYISIHNYEFLIYIGVLVLIALVVLFSLEKTKLDQFVLWGLSIWGLAHMVGGGVRIGGAAVYKLHIIDIVNKGGDFFILKMDQVIHFYGFFITAVLIYQLVHPYLKGRSGKFLPVFIAWIGSMGLGAVNEVVEFIAFVLIANTGVGDVYNTGLDLIFNMGGALCGALLAQTLYRSEKR